MKKPETSDVGEVPIIEFGEDRLELMRCLNLFAILKTWGLGLHRPTLPPSVLEEFLAARYGYWTDDVEHPDLIVP